MKLGSQVRSPASPICRMRIYAWVQSLYYRSCWWDVLNTAHTSVKWTCVVFLLWEGLHAVSFWQDQANDVETFNSTSILIGESSGSVVECLTQDRGATGSSLTGITVLWSLSKTIYPSLVLVQPRKTHPCLIKDCWWDVKNQIKQNQTKNQSWFIYW